MNDWDFSFVYYFMLEGGRAQQETWELTSLTEFSGPSSLSCRPGDTVAVRWFTMGERALDFWCMYSPEPIIKQSFTGGAWVYGTERMKNNIPIL